MAINIASIITGNQTALLAAFLTEKLAKDVHPTYRCGPPNQLNLEKLGSILECAAEFAKEIGVTNGMSRGAVEKALTEALAQAIATLSIRGIEDLSCKLKVAFIEASTANSRSMLEP